MSLSMYEQQAHRLVDIVIEQALQQVEDLNNKGLLYIDKPSSKKSSVKFNMSSEVETVPEEEPAAVLMEEDYEVQNIEWLTIEEFTVERAEEKIHEFVKTWDYQDSWLYCIDYMGEDEHEFDVRYRFRVRWSIPSRRKPVPRATACVYFTFEVSKIKPKDYPVEVFYVFEANRLIHRPGQSRFREKWLKDIIESKVNLMEAVNF